MPPPRPLPRRRPLLQLPGETTEAGDRLIAVGIFGAAHGVRGEVRLKSYTADPSAIADFGSLTDRQGRVRWRVTAARTVRDDMLVVKLADVSDRTAAQALTGRELFVPRASLPVAEEDEFYHADLIGLRAETEAGDAVGLVAAVHNYGAGDLLEIAVPGARETLLLPFTKVAVPRIDVAGRRLIVVPPAEVDEDPPTARDDG